MLVSKENRLDQKYKVYLVIMGLLNVNCGLPLFIFPFLSFSVSVSPTFHQQDLIRLMRRTRGDCRLDRVKVTCGQSFLRAILLKPH